MSQAHRHGANRYAIALLACACFLATGVVSVARRRKDAARFDVGPASEVVTQSQALLAVSRGTRYDAILVLGGGPPLSARSSMPFVEARLDAAKALFDAHGQNEKPALLCLSAGTTHAKQLMDAGGLPIWESTATAAALLDRGVPADRVFVETTSFDTIGNAFFARIAHTDIAGWRRLAIITTDWHMERTREIFEWVFRAEPCPTPYLLHYVATPSVGLTGEAVAARSAREASSLRSVARLARNHPSLRSVHSFLSLHHDLYAAEKLANRAAAPGNAHHDTALLETYGA